MLNWIMAKPLDPSIDGVIFFTDTSLLDVICIWCQHSTINMYVQSVTFFLGDSRSGTDCSNFLSFMECQHPFCFIMIFFLSYLNCLAACWKCKNVRCNIITWSSVSSKAASSVSGFGSTPWHFCWTSTNSFIFVCDGKPATICISMVAWYDIIILLRYNHDYQNFNWMKTKKKKSNNS